MDLETFLRQRRPEWKRLEQLLERAENSGLRALDDAQAVEFARLYRRTASDLNQAQTFVAGDTTAQYLNDLVARCYLIIHGRTRVDLLGFVRTLAFGYPAVVRRCWPHLLLATTILVAGMAFGFTAVHFDSESAREALIPEADSLIKPGDEGHLQSSGQLAAFSSFLFTHNTQVTLVVAALGLTWGIGTALLLWITGIQMGALAAMFLEAGDAMGYATGVLPHGVLEIPSVLLGGAAGFVLAQAMTRARPWPRLDELARAGRLALWLVGGCFPLLAMAAILEAGVARAPDWYLDSGFKLAMAGLFGLLFLAYVLLLGRGKTGAELAAVGDVE